MLKSIWSILADFLSHVCELCGTAAGAAAKSWPWKGLAEKSGCECQKTVMTLQSLATSSAYLVCGGVAFRVAKHGFKHSSALLRELVA